LQMTCFECGSKRGKAFFTCQGLACGEGRRCHHTSLSGGCSWLPQAVPTSPGQECAVFRMEVEDRAMFRFDPCGHQISLEALSGQVRALVEGGKGSMQLKVSPDTEQFSFTCPLGCSHSFLHSIHHFKTCSDLKWYRHMHDWALRRLLESEEQVGPEEERDESREADEGSTSKLSLKTIQDALTEASTSWCPKCNTRGQKDGNCTHITCECGHEYCYICNVAWRHHRRGVCPLYLNDSPELDEDEYKALQKFHVLKVLQRMHAFYTLDAAGFERILDENPQLLLDICPYDGIDEEGELDPDAKLEGVNLTLEDVKNFTRPTWLPELPTEKGEDDDEPALKRARFSSGNGSDECEEEGEEECEDECEEEGEDEREDDWEDDWVSESGSSN